MDDKRLLEIMDQVSLVLDSMPDDLSPLDVSGGLTMLAAGIAIGAGVPRKELEAKIFELLNYMYEQESITVLMDEHPLH